MFFHFDVGTRFIDKHAVLKKIHIRFHHFCCSLSSLFFSGVPTVSFKVHVILYRIVDSWFGETKSLRSTCGTVHGLLRSYWIGSVDAYRSAVYNYHIALV